MRQKAVELFLYPYDGNSVDTVVTGMVLLATSILAIPGFILSGFFAQTLLASINGDDTPPDFELSWETIKEQIIYGIELVFISSVYLFIMLIILLSVYAAIANLIGVEPTMQTIDPQNPSTITSITVFSLILLPTLSSVIFAPISCAIYITQESVFDAFNPRRVGEVVWNKEYMIGVGKAILVGIIGSIITGFTNQVPLIGYAIPIYVAFNVYLIGFHVIGDGIRKADPYLRNVV